MGHIVRVNRNKVRAHDGEVVIVDAEDPCSVDRCVDDTQDIFLVLQCSCYLSILCLYVSRGILPSLQSC